MEFYCFQCCFPASVLAPGIPSVVSELPCVCDWLLQEHRLSSSPSEQTLSHIAPCEQIQMRYIARQGQLTLQTFLFSPAQFLVEFHGQTSAWILPSRLVTVIVWEELAWVENNNQEIFSWERSLCLCCPCSGRNSPGISPWTETSDGPGKLWAEICRPSRLSWSPASSLRPRKLRGDPRPG